jgi:DNA-binding transcriptional LysR family regulator
MNIAAIDLNLLVAFEALWEERHLSRAAVRVGLSQPAMSNALRRLRELFDDPLFVRGSRGMTPTARATQLAEPVRAGLGQIRLAVADRAVFDASTTVRTFRVAMNDYAELRMAGRLMSALQRDAPGVQMELRRSEKLFIVPEEELRTGTLDAAIGFFPDAGSLEGLIRVKELFSEENVLIARRGHPLLRSPITVATFAAAGQAAIFYKSEPRGLIDRVLAAEGLQRHLMLKTPHFLSVPQVVAESDLIACVPEGLAQSFAKQLNLVVRRLPFAMPRFCMRMAWHPRTDEDPAQVWMRGALESAGHITRMSVQVSARRQSASVDCRC